MTVLVASDLDRTLIYSRQACVGQDDLVCVERKDGAPLSYMTALAAAAWAELAAQTLVMPVTTRVPEQYQRVRLPGYRPRFAIAANGGVLYVDGTIDGAWSERVAKACAESAPLHEVWRRAASACRPDWTENLRSAEGLFCYAVVRPELVPPGFEDDITAWAAELGWRTSVQGRKVYWVPEALTKSAAVAEVARRLDASLVLAAGDSLLDLDLLQYAHRAIHPCHGELHERGWSAPHVVCTELAGADAAEEIIAWFREHAG